MKNIDINEYFVITKTAQGKSRASFQVAWLSPEQNTAATNMWYAVSDAGYLSNEEKNGMYREVAPKEVAPKEVAPEEVAPEEVAPEEVAPEVPAVPEWVNAANQNPPGSLQNFKVLKQVYEQGSFNRIYDTEDLPSTSIDGSAINKTGTPEGDAPLLQAENSKRDKKRREYSILANLRYKPRSGESLEEMSMRLATPAENNGIRQPGLSTDEIQEITGGSWSQDKYQQGLQSSASKARKAAIKRQARPQINILDKEYRAARLRIQEMPKNQRASATARLKAVYARQMQNIMSNAELQLG